MAGWAVAETDDIDLAPVTEVWRELLDRRLDAAAYRGFGWMAVNDRLEEDSWLTLTQETAAVTAGALDEADRVAERAAQSPADPRAAVIIVRLLEDDPHRGTCNGSAPAASRSYERPPTATPRRTCASTCSHAASTTRRTGDARAARTGDYPTLPGKWCRT
jgi:hypothetical protein